MTPDICFFCFLYFSPNQNHSVCANFICKKISGTRLVLAIGPLTFWKHLWGKLTLRLYLLVSLSRLRKPTLLAHDFNIIITFPPTMTDADNSTDAALHPYIGSDGAVKERVFQCLGESWAQSLAEKIKFILLNRAIVSNAHDRNTAQMLDMSVGGKWVSGWVRYRETDTESMPLSLMIPSSSRCIGNHIQEGEEDYYSQQRLSTPLKWVAPCRCILSLRYVHEVCLLRWIAQKQSSSSTSSTSNFFSQSPVSCPACGFQYRLKEQWDGVRWFVATINRMLDSLTGTLSLAGATFSLYITFSAYGGKREAVGRY